MLQNIKKAVREVFQIDQAISESSSLLANTAYSGSWPAGISNFFNGEKQLAALGPAKKYNVDYYTMADRAWDLYTVNEFARAAVNRVAQFAVGLGLTFHSEPEKDFLKNRRNIVISKSFANDNETLWFLWSRDKKVSIDDNDNLDSLGLKVFVNSFLSGDCLCINYIVDGKLKVKVVDGRNVGCSLTKNTNNGNEIRLGVELDKNGKHVAYWVREKISLDATRIPAFDKDGRVIAWLCYADKNRIGSVRGYSRLGAIMQKLDNIGNYTENEVIASNVNSKFAGVVEHSSESSGLNPFMTNNLGLRSASVPEENSVSSDIGTSETADNIRMMTSGLIVSMPKGQKFSSFDTKRPNLHYCSFIETNAKFMYSSLDVPYEVVLMVFQSNFSASRASMKMFEMILKIMRKNIIIDGFYNVVYQRWFELEVLKNNIRAPKFTEMCKSGDDYGRNAYMACRFVGYGIPHVDPQKEVNAVVTKLKNRLTTFEAALEELGDMSDFNTMAQKLGEQIKHLEASGVDTSFLIENNSSENKGENDERTEQTKSREKT